MKYIIDIPEKVYKIIQGWDDKTLSWSENLIKTATPLPKGHGRLIDADELLTLFHDGTEGYDCATYTRYEIGNILEVEAPTIIEADKEQEDDNT